MSHFSESLADLTAATAPNFAVAPFTNPATMPAIAAMHLEVRYSQRERGESTFKGRILSSQADLNAIPANYQDGGGNFFVATRAIDNKIVGIVGLKRESKRVGRIKRMAVSPEFEGNKTVLCCSLLPWIGANGQALRNLYFQPESEKRLRTEFI